MRTTLSGNFSCHEQRGFTLLEIMIALLIGLFMVGGLITLVLNNRQASLDQSKLAQLEDSERLATILVTDVVQSAGYFPDPTNYTAANTLPARALDADYPAFAIGQAIAGTYNAIAPGDTLTVRFTTADSDGILNCSGAANVTGGNATYINKYSVINNQLVCTMNGTQYTLASGVQSMQVLYGVKTTVTVDNNVDIYRRADQVTNWSNVVSVIVKLNFINPFNSASLLPVERVIGIMNRTGPKT